MEIFPDFCQGTKILPNKKNISFTSPSSRYFMTGPLLEQIYGLD